MNAKKPMYHFVGKTLRDAAMDAAMDAADAAGGADTRKPLDVPGDDAELDYGSDE